MRAKRILRATAALLACAAALAVAAALLPPVQTWAARRALSSLAAPGTASLGRLSVGLSRMSVEGLVVERDGAVLRVPSADAELSVLSAAAGRGFLVRNLSARGWTLDLTRPGGGAAPRAPEGAGGPGAGARAAETIGVVLRAFNVPEDLSLDGLDLQGAVVLPDEGGRRIGTAQIALSGGGLAAGRSGRFRCNADVALDDAGAPVSAVAVRGTLDAAMDPTGTFARADLRVDATARGRDLPGGINLSGTLSAARGQGKTTYALSLFRGLQGIASLDAASPDGSRRLSGSWKLDLRDTDLAPFALGRRLPSFHLAGDGVYDVDADSGDLHASGKARARADRLGVVAGALAALGRVELLVDFDVARTGAALHVERLETSLAASSPVASVRALQPFEFNTATGELKVARPSDDIVGISVAGLPLAWAGDLPDGLAVSGGDMRGEFVMRAENGRLALRTKAPLVSSGFGVSRGGRALASGLDVSVFLLADYSLQGWQVQVAPLSVRSEGLRMFSLEARLGRLSGPGQAVKAAGSWSALLPELLREPGLRGLARVSAGEASGSFEASLGQTREVRLKVSLGSLAAGDAQAVELPAVTAEARLSLSQDGRCEFNVPVRLDYESRQVNLACSGTAYPGGERPFEAALAADTLGGADLAALAALAQAPAAGASAAQGAQAAAAPARPFWPALRGRVSLALHDVSVRGIRLRDVRGSVAVAPASLKVESAMAGVGDASAVRLDGVVAFAQGGDAPYALTAEVSADNLDSAPLFLALDPSRPPAVEGRFDLAGHVAGAGADLDGILSALQGDCRLTSKDGRFRMLQVDVAGAFKQTPSMIEGALDSVGALFGKKAEKIAEAMVQSAAGLADIHYDQLSLSLERGPDLDIAIKAIALTAPEERITGEGRITHVPGVPVGAQPLSVDLDVGARGALAKFMGVVGLLADGQDELGYTHLYEPVQLRGSLQRVDRSQLRQMLLQAPLRKGGGLFDKLLGR